MDEAGQSLAERRRADDVLLHGVSGVEQVEGFGEERQLPGPPTEAFFDMGVEGQRVAETVPAFRHRMDEVGALSEILCHHEAGKRLTVLIANCGGEPAT